MRVRPLPGPPVSGLASALVLTSALVLAACTGGASSSPRVSPGSSSPAGSPDGLPTSSTGLIAHPAGATDLVLRFEEGGGFVAPSFALAQVPYFSLYGDGTVLYRPVSAPIPEQSPGEPLRFPSLRIAHLTETQVQALLRDALGAGGLGIARPRYESQGIADAPTAVFTMNADGRQKTVSVYALGIALGGGASAGPDTQVLSGMATLAERLRNFDQDVTAGKAADLGLFRPDRYRASLLEGAFAEGPARAWPWPTFGPDAFTPLAGPGGVGFPSKVLDGSQVALLGIADVEGGVSGIPLAGPDGKVYVLGLRPLLPDEQR